MSATIVFCDDTFILSNKLNVKDRIYIMWLVIYLLIIVLEYRCTSSNVDVIIIFLTRGFPFKIFFLFKMTAPIALITGYTGESGKALVNRLVKSNQYRKVILVGRRNVEYTDNDFKEKTVIYQHYIR